MGIGEGTLNSKVPSLPEAHTDYIVSVISEEFGVIIVIGILFLYLIFSYKIISKKLIFISEDLSKLILIGCVSLILLQTFYTCGCKYKSITHYRNDSYHFKLWWFINSKYSNCVWYNIKFNKKKTRLIK